MRVESRWPTEESDALALLGDDKKASQAIQRFFGVGILAGAALDPVVFAPLFEVASELGTQLGALADWTVSRIRSSDKRTRDELIERAHSILAVAALREAISAELERIEQVHARSGGSKWTWAREVEKWISQSGGKRGEIGTIVDWYQVWSVRPPAASRSFTTVYDDLQSEYGKAGRDVLAYVSGLEIWDTFDWTQRQAIKQRLFHKIPQRAGKIYRRSYISLASKVPDFAVWAFLNEHQSLAQDLKEMHESGLEALRHVAVQLAQIESIIETQSRALSTLSELQCTVGSQRENIEAVSEGCDRISDRYKKLHQELYSPILTIADENVEAGAQFPSIDSGYIEPLFRVSSPDDETEPRSLDNHEWWKKKAPRSKLSQFLYALAREPSSAKQPILVLGEPGAGKTLLTKILAARYLPSAGICVRVELRSVTDTSDITTLLDNQVKSDSNGSYTWRQLTDGTSGLDRMVIFDGLDELLQLRKSASDENFLRAVAMFQQREAAMGNPTVAMVTSRTLAMQGAVVPEGVTVLQLAVFNKDQIHAWVDTWNRTNSEWFRLKGRQPCDVAVVLRMQHLAEQPLLLMMLALYDADAQALRQVEDLSEYVLYERIFDHFIYRELVRSRVRVAVRDKRARVRREWLERVGAAMFALGTKAITVLEIKKEAAQSFQGKGVEDVRERDFRGFYFLSSSRALSVDAEQLYGYEFVHATFGEYFAARAICEALYSIVQFVENGDLERARKVAFCSVIARRPLVSESKVLQYAVEKLTFEERLSSVRKTLLSTDLAHVGPALPAHLTPSSGAALAVFCLNATLLALILSDRSIEIGQIATVLPGADGWKSTVRLWRTGCNNGDWDAVLRWFELESSRGDESAHLRLSLRNTVYRYGPDAFPEEGDFPGGYWQIAAEAALTRNAVLSQMFELWRASASTRVDYAPSSHYVHAISSSVALGHGMAPLMQMFPGDPQKVWRDSFPDLRYWLDEDVTLLAVTGEPPDYGRMGILTRELIRRGLTDLALSLMARFFKSSRGGPAAGEEADFASLARIAMVYDFTAIRRPISFVIPLSGCSEVLARHLGRECLDWLER